MKTMTAIFFLLILIGTTSCKKHYVCTCTTEITEPAYSYDGINFHGSEDYEVVQETYKEKKQESAEAQCRFNEYTITYSSPNEAQGQGLTTEAKSCILTSF